MYDVESAGDSAYRYFLSIFPRHRNTLMRCVECVSIATDRFSCSHSAFLPVRCVSCYIQIWTILLRCVSYAKRSCLSLKNEPQFIKKT